MRKFVLLAAISVLYSLNGQPSWEIDGDPSDFNREGALSFKPVDPPSAAGKFKEMLVRKDKDAIRGAIYIDETYKGYKPDIRWTISVQIRDNFDRRIDATFTENHNNEDEIDVKASYWNGEPHTRSKDLDPYEFNCICENPGCEFEIPVKELTGAELNITVRKRAINEPHESRIHGYWEDWDEKLLKAGNSPVFDGLPYDFPMGGATIVKGGAGSLAGKWSKMALKIEGRYLTGAAFHDIAYYRSSHFKDVYILISDSKGNALKYKFANTLIDYAQRQEAPSKRWTDYSMEGAQNICTRHGCEFKFPLEHLQKGPVAIEYIRRGYITRTGEKHESKISGVIRY